MISDHPLSTSGVGTQSRFLIDGLLKTGKYTFRCLGAAMKHVNYDTVAVTPDFIVKPIDGFGNIDLIRQLLVSEKPDAILLFTDPRFFDHIWQIEDEIHQICPIAYNNIWDNNTFEADYNKYVYDSCDLLCCINRPSFEMVSKWFPEKTHYVPHAVPAELYRPLPDEMVRSFKQNLMGPRRANNFSVLYVSRNAHRKRTSDVMWAFKSFLDAVEQKYGHRNVNLVMHTNPLDMEGPNLYAVASVLGLNDNVIFSRDQIQFDQMNLLYNACDTLINISTAEGFGLPLLEMKMAGRPIIALKTGGMTRQVEDHETGEQYGVALPVEMQKLTGSQTVPYICDDLVSNETVSRALLKMFEMTPDARRALGLRAREHALKNYSFEEMISNWDSLLMDTIENWRARRRSWRHVEI